MSEIFVHPSAYVSPDAVVGTGSKIWINVQIREFARIGCDCIISKDVYIDHAVTVGSRCKIQNGVSVYHGVTIEDDVFIGPNVAFSNDKVPRAFNAEWKVAPTWVRHGVSIGSNATIVCGVEIGAFAMIGAGSVVTRSIPAHALVMGNPARVVGFVCECGHRLGDDGRCLHCGKSMDLTVTGVPE